MKIVLLTPDDPELAARVAAAAPEAEVVVAADEAAAQTAIVDADALYGRITPELLAAATRLRWVQSPAIGLERTMFPELIAHPLILTNPRGIFSDDIADHVLAFVLYFARGFHRHTRNQIGRRWAPGHEHRVIHLADATIGVVGLGGIGAAVAARAKAHGMRVVAVDARRAAAPPEVDHLRGPEGLREMLAESDFVAICAPETPETRGLFDAAVLRSMKTGAFLINIGRGRIVRLDALVETLREGKLGGAGLDVFEIEPLPPEHPLWAMENVVITPHMAGLGPHTGERRHSVLLENVRRFAAGAELTNVVDKQRWF